jgi:hypothetical protein
LLCSFLFLRRKVSVFKVFFFLNFWFGPSGIYAIFQDSNILIRNLKFWNLGFIANLFFLEKKL